MMFETPDAKIRPRVHELRNPWSGPPTDNVYHFKSQPFSIPPPQKRATPKPAFGRFVPSTGEGMLIKLCYIVYYFNE